MKGILRWLLGLVIRTPYFPPSLAFVLEGSWRRLFISPETLVTRLRLGDTDAVLEIGCGPGYFTVAVARALGSGSLTALDVQWPMLERARSKALSASAANIAFAQGHASRLPFADASFDIAFMVTVLGELPDERTVLRELGRVLRPGGALSISEHVPDPDFVNFETVRQKCEEAGFTFAGRSGHPWSYTAHFLRP